MQTKTITSFRKISMSSCVADLAASNETSIETVLTVLSPVAIFIANAMFDYKSDQPVALIPDG